MEARKRKDRYADVPLFDFISKEAETTIKNEKQIIKRENAEKAIRMFGSLKPIADKIEQKKNNNIFETLSRIPAGTILDKTVNLLLDKTDFSANIIFWYVLASLGGYLTQRNKRIEFGTQAIAPNLWITILAKSSGGKTWILNKIKEFMGGKIYFYAPGWQSKAAFVADLAAGEKQNPPMKHCIIEIDEIAQTIKLFRSSGAGATLKEAHLTAYDGTMRHTTKTDGTIEIEDIALTVLAATVIDTFTDSITPEDLNDGYIQRYMLILSKENERNMQNWPYEIRRSEVEEIQNSFRAFAEKINNIEKFSISDKAKALWQKWYSDNFNKNLESHYKRYLWANLKIAAIYNALLEGDGIITPEDMSWSLRVTEDSLSSLYKIMDRYMHFDRWEKLNQKVRSIYEENPNISDRDVMRKATINAKILNIVKDTLTDRGYLSAPSQQQITDKQRLQPPAIDAVCQ